MGGGPGPAWRLPANLPLVFATFVSHFFTFGPLYAFGVFLPPLKAHFGVTLGAATAVHSLMISTQFVGSLIAGLLIPRYASHRAVAAAGSLLVLAGYLLAASAESLAVMYAAMGPLVGLGLGACNLAGLTALNARVRERRALAVGLATCGTSVGTMALPPAYSGLISAVGWRWALRANGLATGALLLAVAPLFWVPKAIGAGGAGAGAKGRLWKFPCMDMRYLCWWLNMVLCFLGYFTPATLLAQFGQKEVGASPQATSAMYTVLGACALLTRGSLGCITACAGGPRRVHLASQLAAGLATLLLPWCRSQAALFAWSAAYGLAIGPLIALISVILSELFGTEVLPLYHGCSRLGVGIGSLLGPPAIALLVDSAGYGAALAAAGLLILSGTAFLLLLAWLQARKVRAEALAEAPPVAGESAGTAAGGAAVEGDGAADAPTEAAGGPEQAAAAADRV